MIVHVIWRCVALYLCIVQVHCRMYEIWNLKALQDNFGKKTDSVDIPNTDVDSPTINGMNNYNMINEMTRNFIGNMMDEVRLSFDKAASFSSHVMNQRNIFSNSVEPSYIPDIDLNSLQLIVKYGYKGESHVVKTEDGYLLTIHRIPCSNVKLKSNASKCQPVFLQHGLLASSSDFIETGPNKGLAFILADAGYDVWLGNFRGNTYSRAHVNISKDDSSFWDFSWHECAMYDLPAMIDYVNEYMNVKNETIYIGHSMGTTTLFALLSTKPEYNKKLKAAFTLAPVAYMKSLKSPIRFLSKFVDSIEWIRKYLGLNEFLPENIIIKWLAKDCDKYKIDQRLCENVLFLICGYDQPQLDVDILPVILGHTPAGASTKTIIHFAQEIRDEGKFQMYDYGSTVNKKKYGQSTPPQYNISDITLPIAFLCGENDWLSAVSDAQRLYQELANPIEFYKVPYKEFNHLDFLWAKDAPTLVYKKLMDLMSKFN